jgi:hypothetical protein
MPEEEVGRVTVPTFELASNPTISLSAIRERRFNLIERRAPPYISIKLGVVAKYKSALERIVGDELFECSD